MSRIGRLPIKLPTGVDCKVEGNVVKVKGAKGSLERPLPPHVKVELKDKAVHVTRESDERLSRSMHGLARTLINNMVVGVSEGYSKQLNIVGVGFKVELKGKDLLMQLGFSHPVNFAAPTGIQFEVDAKKNCITVKGIDKESVGQTSANIRNLKPPEPYKGKGIMYAGEILIRKAGKAAVGATGGK
jgi:large subunit ribosomal protein L6